MLADNPQTTKIIRIQSLYPATLKYTGRVSGKQYVWGGAGKIVDVNEEDASQLLSKKIRAKGCCGVQSDGNLLFQQYKEA